MIRIDKIKQKIKDKLYEMKAGTLVIAIMIISFLILAVINILVVAEQVRQLALEEAGDKAEILINHNLAIHSYFNSILKPKVYSAAEGVIDEDYFDPIWMSSTYAVREIDREFQFLSAFSNYYYKEAAINARSPANEADDFEREFLVRLNLDPSLKNETTIRMIDGAPFLVTLVRGETMEADCLQCHSTPDAAPAQLVSTYGDQRSFGRYLGQTVSAISIRIPLAEAFNEASRSSISLSMVLIISFVFLLIFTSRFIHRYLGRPLSNLQLKALSIAEDENFLGEAIPLPFGKEFRDLTIAFNDLSKKLRRHQDDLEIMLQERTHSLNEKQQFLDSMLMTLPNQVCLLSVETGEILYSNREMKTFWGSESYQKLKKQGAKYYEKLVHPESLDDFRNFQMKTKNAKGEEVIIQEYRVIREEKIFWLECRAVVFQRDEDGDPSQILFIAEDISDNKAIEEKLRYLGLHDPLTELPNRNYFEDCAQAYIKNQQFPLAVMMTDLDNLKLINDDFGHDQGDYYLVQIARILRSALRKDDVVARIGGDEFAVLLPNTDAKTAERIKKRIQEEIDRNIAFSRGDIKTNLSIGIAILESGEDMKTFRQAIRSADKAMYREKNERKSNQS